MTTGVIQHPVNIYYEPKKKTMYFRISALLLFSFFSVFLMAQYKAGIDYLGILKRAAMYSTTSNDSFPKFTYQSENESELMELRKRFNLDSVAGSGNETSRIINLLHFVHNTVKHDGQHESGVKEINANSIISAAKDRGVGVSCGELATTLNDCYLAMGWKSRKIYCFPKDSLRTDRDSHVINIVWLTSKKKWVWMDPTNDAYVMDDHGELLSIQEVRKRLIAGMPLKVNSDANWNHKSAVEKSYYLDTYMAKNLYRFYSPISSEYNYETWGRDKRVVYVYLFPLDYTKPMPFRTDDYFNPQVKTTFNTYNLFNEKMFWQPPSQ